MGQETIPAYARIAGDSRGYFDPTLIWPAERRRDLVKETTNHRWVIYMDTVQQKRGVVSYAGKMLLSPIAKYIDWIYENDAAIAYYTLNDKYGFVTEKGQVIPAEYDKYEYPSTNNIILYQGNKKFILTPDAIITPCSD